MTSFMVPGKPLTIVNGATESEALLAHFVYDDAIALCIVAPASLGAAVSSVIELVRNPEESVLTFAGYEEGESGSLVAVTGPVAGTGRVYFGLAATPGFRIVLNTDPGEDVTFEVFKLMGAS